jgi:hypothetical protein
MYSASVFRTGLKVNGLELWPQNMKIVRGKMSEEHKQRIAESVRRAKSQNKKSK